MIIFGLSILFIIIFILQYITNEFFKYLIKFEVYGTMQHKLIIILTIMINLTIIIMSAKVILDSFKIT